ncbi:hypothetical protein [Pseudomonas sp. MPB23]|uniref:hypothetical protein n=1 Tax=Pseudomonas sp. MPB23 TaxID=3388490 RepID=UPI0039847D7E
MKQLFEFKEVFGDDDAPEVLMSRLNDENNDLEHPDYTVRLSSLGNNGTYYVISKPEDVDGDNDRDEDDASYYELAAQLVMALVTLSAVGEQKRFERVLIKFNPASKTDVDILHFKHANTDISAPDYVVTATNPDRVGRYRTINNPIDADGDGDIDNNDSLIYRQLATSFASMKDLRP